MQGSYVEQVEILTGRLAELLDAVKGSSTSDGNGCSASVGPPVFPSEVTDIIIDHLHDCRYALKKCSLVCKDWKASSRYHLFHTAIFAPEKVAFSDLLTFLASAPDVCPYIQDLTLSGYRGISLKDLRAALAALTSLRSLSLDRLHISRPHGREPALEPIPVDVLHTLRISSSNVLEHDSFVFLRLLRLFSEVTSLHLSYTQSSFAFNPGQYRSRLGFAHTEVEEFPADIGIQDLVLRALPTHMLDLIFRPDYLPDRWASLHTLCIDGGCSTWKHVGRIGEFIDVMGPQLRQFAVRPPYMLLARDELLINLNGQITAQTGTSLPDMVENWRPLRLDKCRKLEVFKMSVGHDDNFAPPPRDSNAVFKATMDLLTHLPSSTAQVRVSFSSDRHRLLGEQFEEYRVFLMALDWQALDCTLSADRFERLKVVLDIGLVRLAFDEVQCRELFRCVTDALPRLSARNMIALEYTKEKWWVYDLWD